MSMVVLVMKMLADEGFVLVDVGVTELYGRERTQIHEAVTKRNLNITSHKM